MANDFSSLPCITGQRISKGLQTNQEKHFISQNNVDTENGSFLFLTFYTVLFILDPAEIISSKENAEQHKAIR